MVEIHQDSCDLAQLLVVSEEDGIGMRDRIRVASSGFVQLLDRDAVRRVRVKTGFGEYTLRKRRRRGHPYWYAVRRVSSSEREIYLGKTEDITTEQLGDVAVRLYEDVAPRDPLGATAR